MTFDEWTHEIEEPEEDVDAGFLVEKGSMVDSNVIENGGAYDLLDNMSKAPSKTIYTKQEIMDMFGVLPDHDDLDNIIVRNKLLITLDKLDKDRSNILEVLERLSADPNTDPKEIHRKDSALKSNENLRLQILQMLDKHNQKNLDRKTPHKIESHIFNLDLNSIHQIMRDEDTKNVTPKD